MDRLQDAGVVLSPHECVTAARFGAFLTMHGADKISPGQLANFFAPILAKSVAARSVFLAVFQDVFKNESQIAPPPIRPNLLAGFLTRAPFEVKGRVVRLIGGVLAITVIAASAWFTWRAIVPLWWHVAAINSVSKQSAQNVSTSEPTHPPIAAEVRPTEATGTLLRSQVEAAFASLHHAADADGRTTLRTLSRQLARVRGAPRGWQLYLKKLMRFTGFGPGEPLNLRDARVFRVLGLAILRMDAPTEAPDQKDLQDIVAQAMKGTGIAVPAQLDAPLPDFPAETYVASWWLSGSVAAAPLLAAAWWFLARVRRRKAFLRSRPPRAPPLANELVVRAANDAARAHESLLQTANRLYRRVSDTHSDELDVVATATRTADAGGQFSPVWAPRRVIPEYLILIETRGEHDHEALRLDALVSTLSASGLDIVRYYMKHDSNLCFQAPDKPAMRLDVLSARHPYHRLLVLGTGQVFINPAITQPWPWADEVLKWEHRAILTPAPLENWGRHESALAHLFAGPVGRATSEGFQELASLLDRVAMPDPTSFRVPYVARPFTWTSWYDNWVKRPDYWLGPDEIDSADWADLERMLQDYFTDEYGVFDRPAFDWLAACAVYPAIRWDLTVFLGVKLRWVDANGVELPVYTEARCARLASLPWFHAGYMPAWLRRRLIATIGPSQRVAVAHHLTDILERAVMGDEDATDAVRLKIYHDHPDIYAGEPLRDEVFLDFLAARDELWFQVPKKLSDIFHNLRSRQMFQECATLGLIALYSAATIVLVPWPSDGPLATGSWVPVGVLALSVVTWPLAKWLTKSWWPAP
jgi:hypothetical protein